MLVTSIRVELVEVIISIGGEVIILEKVMKARLIRLAVVQLGRRQTAAVGEDGQVKGRKRHLPAPVVALIHLVNGGAQGT